MRLKARKRKGERGKKGPLKTDYALYFAFETSRRKGKARKEMLHPRLKRRSKALRQNLKPWT
jgi:hypothetical protein